MSETSSTTVPAGVFTNVTSYDGESKTSRVVEGQIFVCKGCCCGNVERDQPAVPLESFKREWKERGIRTRVHLTISGCLGPCAVPNVVLFLYKGSTLWLRSINSESDVIDIYDYVERLLELGRFDSPSGRLAEKTFERYSGDAVCVPVVVKDGERH